MHQPHHMMVDRAVHLSYILVAAVAVIAACVTRDLRNLVIGAIALVILFEASQFLRSYYDDRLPVPGPEVSETTGDADYRVIVSKFIYGTCPFYIFSDGRRIAVLYRGSDVTFRAPSDATVEIIRASQEDRRIRLSPGPINYVSIQGNIDGHGIAVDQYEEEDDIDESRYRIEYEYLRSQFLGMDKGGLITAVTSVMILIGLYLKM